MARWSIRNYNSFIREARKKSDLTQGQARNVYRQVAARLERPANGVDVKKHPRIFSSSAKLATGVTRKVSRVSISEAAPSGGGGGGGGGGSIAGGSGTSVNSLSDWGSYLDDFDLDFDYPWDEYESSADYGEE